MSTLQTKLVLLSLAFVCLVACCGCSGKTNTEGEVTIGTTIEQQPFATGSSDPVSPLVISAASDEMAGLETSNENIRPEMVPSSANAAQMLIVSVSSQSDTEGTLSLWNRNAGQWDSALSVPCFVGREGVGESSEDAARTPSGVFHLDMAFGIQPDPGCPGFSYRQIGADDWWVSDPESPLYNTYVTASFPVDAGFEPSWGEHLIECGSAYDYVLNVATNPDCVPYAGSAIFIHVSEEKPTEGCVSVGEEAMLALLSAVSPDTLVAIGTPEMLSEM